MRLHSSLRPTVGRREKPPDLILHVLGLPLLQRVEDRSQQQFQVSPVRRNQDPGMVIPSGEELGTLGDEVEVVGQEGAAFGYRVGEL